MKPAGLSANALATALQIPPNRLSEIVRGRRGITADTALRLARYFGTTPNVWLNLQQSYDLGIAQAQNASAVRRIRPAVRA